MIEASIRRARSFEEWRDRIFRRNSVVVPLGESVLQVRRVDDQTVLAWIAVLFANARTLLQLYTPDEVADGIWWIFSAGESSYSNLMYEDSLELEARLRVVRSVRHLYLDMFDVAVDACAHSGAGAETSRLQQTCYMLWDLDLLTFCNGGVPSRIAIEQCQFEVIEALLSSCRSEECHFSLIHGLSHAVESYGTRATAILLQFSKRDGVTTRVREFAIAAMSGKLQ